MDDKCTIAIDPSINYIGYSVFVGEKLIDHGVYTTNRRTKGDVERLRKIYGAVQQLCSMFNPTTAVIEDWQWRHTDVRSNKNNLKKLIWAIGIAATATPDSCNVVFYKPQDWKKNKDKTVTIRMAQLTYGITGKLNNNAADAIMMGHHFIHGDGQKKLQLIAKYSTQSVEEILKKARAGHYGKGGK